MSSGIVFEQVVAIQNLVMQPKLIFIVFFCTIQSLICQEKWGKPFFTGAANLTFGVNEHYTLDPDDGETLLIPTAIFLRTGFGYEIKKRVAFSFNIGLDYHWNYAVSAIPTYGSLRYNITEKHNDAFLWKRVMVKCGVYHKNILMENIIALE